MKTKLGLIPLLTIAAALALGAPASAHEEATPDRDGFIWEDCYILGTGGIPVPYDRADALVPDGYTVAAIDDLNTSQDERFAPEGERLAAVVIDAVSCKSATVGEVPVLGYIDSRIGIGLVPWYDFDCSDDGQCCSPGACPEPPPHNPFLAVGAHVDSPADRVVYLEQYNVQWITTSKEQARWLRRATGLGDRVRVVPGLKFDYDPVPPETDPVTGRPLAGAVDLEFRVSAPPPAPSPFHVGCESGVQGCMSFEFGCGSTQTAEQETECAMFSEPPPEAFLHGENGWSETGEGTVIIHSDDLAHVALGLSAGTVTADDSNSPLGVLFGADRTKNFDNTGISEVAPRRQWTKCVRTTSGECSPDNHPDPCAEPLGLLDPACDPLVDPLLMSTTAAPVGALVLIVAAGAAAGWLRRRRATTARTKEGSA